MSQVPEPVGAVTEDRLESGRLSVCVSIGLMSGYTSMRQPGGHPDQDLFHHLLFLASITLIAEHTWTER
jgi:hypothetical protein